MRGAAARPTHAGLSSAEDRTRLVRCPDAQMLKKTCRWTGPPL